jgi:biotin transport system substrate-specific component
MYGDDRRALIISQTAAFTALIAAGGWVSIPFVPVPFTLQTFFVLLSGMVMKRTAVLPTFALILLGVLNLPVFHNGYAGIGVLLGPTGGYIAGFVLAALIVGIAYERPHKGIRIAGIIAGSVAILLAGAVWLMYSTGLPATAALLIGFLPFIPGDCLKGTAAYLIGERYG